MKAQALDDIVQQIGVLLADFEPEERIRVAASALCLADITIARKTLRLVSGRRDGRR